MLFWVKLCVLVVFFLVVSPTNWYSYTVHGYRSRTPVVREASTNTSSLFCGGIVRINMRELNYVFDGQFSSLAKMISPASLDTDQQLHSLIRSEIERIEFLTKNDDSSGRDDGQCARHARDLSLPNSLIEQQYVLMMTSDQSDPLVMSMWDHRTRSFSQEPVVMGMNYHISALNHSHELVVQRTLNNELFVTQHIVHKDQLRMEESCFGHARRSVKVRFMSMNIQNFFKSWRIRSRMIRNIVESNNSPRVDVIGIQEVRLDESRLFDKHQIDLLKKELRDLGFYHYVFQPAMSYISSRPFNGVHRHEEGLAIFSRHEILSTDTLLLARNLSDHLSHQRVALRARIRICNVLDIDFITTHSSLSESERDININDVENHFNTFGLVPQVIVGDFNAEPFERSVKSMFSHKMKWKDSYIEAVDRGQTVFNKTFSIDTKYDKRIDYIMHRGSNSVETKSTNYNVLHEKLDMGHSILNMSDHYFILSDIEFSES